MHFNRWIMALAVLAGAVVGARTASAQTVVGRVLDETDDEPVPTSLVRLIDADGAERGVAIADSTGGYRLTVPEPGVYRLQADRIGFDGLETPLLAMSNPDGTYPVDLLVRRSPVPIEGLEVTTDISTEQADRAVRSYTGLNPRSMRYRPIRWDALQDHAARAHDLTDVMRWSNFAGVVVRETLEGPCYQVRGRSCLPVFLNGFPMNSRFVDVIPVDMVHTMVVLAPKESAAYWGGAVLLYTELMLR